MKELLELIAAREQARHVPYAVATVLRVEGSSYRRPGARMLINVHGRVAGSVSGGCLEKNVIAQGQAAILQSRASLLSFDTTDQEDLAFGASLGCQGKIWIGLEILPPNAPWPLQDIVEEVCRRRIPSALVTHVFQDETGARFESSSVFDESLSDEARSSALSQTEIEETLRTRRTRFVQDDVLKSRLIEWLGPPLVLMLFGGGSDVHPLARLGRELGHRVVVIDRRPDFARAENFPAAHQVLLANPRKIGALVHPDERTVAVLMNHHYDTDRDVLASLLPFNLSYIAMLGPKRRTSQILEELQREGHPIEVVVQTLHGPAGLDIGAETPEQIALAILAEIQATLARRDGGKLRQRKAPIHSDSLPQTMSPCVLPV